MAKQSSPLCFPQERLYLIRSYSEEAFRFRPRTLNHRDAFHHLDHFALRVSEVGSGLLSLRLTLSPFIWIAALSYALAAVCCVSKPPTYFLFLPFPIMNIFLSPSYLELLSVLAHSSEVWALEVRSVESPTSEWRPNRGIVVISHLSQILSQLKMHLLYFQPVSCFLDFFRSLFKYG